LLGEFAKENQAWQRVYQLPAYAPELNPAGHLVAAQAIHGQLRRPNPGDHLVRIVKRKLKRIQYRPHLIDGCLAPTGLTIEPW
jgi:hypothetical protein